LGVWDVCCMYRDLSEKGVIVHRSDLEFESRMWLQRHNGNNSGNPNENAIAIGVWDVCLDVMERIKRSAIVEKRLDLYCICP
jgi:hypothetical protein